MVEITRVNARINTRRPSSNLLLGSESVVRTQDIVFSGGNAATSMSPYGSRMRLVSESDPPNERSQSMSLRSSSSGTRGSSK